MEDRHYGLPSPVMGSYFSYLESEYENPDIGFPQRELNREFLGSPLHHGPGQPLLCYLPIQIGEY